MLPLIKQIALSERDTFINAPSPTPGRCPGLGATFGLSARLNLIFITDLSHQPPRRFTASPQHPFRQPFLSFRSPFLYRCHNLKAAVFAHLLHRSYRAVALMQQNIEGPWRGGRAHQHAPLPLVQGQGQT